MTENYEIIEHAMEFLTKGWIVQFKQLHNGTLNIPFSNRTLTNHVTISPDLVGHISAALITSV